MSIDETARKQLVANWQKKHAVADDDPLFAAVELFDIYAESLNPQTPEKPTNPPSFGEFRDSLEKLDQISKNLTNIAQDLTQQIRKVLPKKQNSGSFGLFVVLITIFLVGGAAYIAWSFILTTP